MELEETVQVLIHRLREFHSAAHLNHIFEECKELSKAECSYVNDNNRYNMFLMEWTYSLYSQLYNESVKRLQVGELDEIDEISVSVDYYDFTKAMEKKYG